jgi:hypothetical protein
MKLMTLLKEFWSLSEEESEASRQAKEMGLEYDGYGNWIDPKTGERKAQTIDGKLVKTDPKQDQPSPDAIASSQPDGTAPAKSTAPTSTAPQVKAPSVFQQKKPLFDKYVQSLRDPNNPELATDDGLRVADENMLKILMHRDDARIDKDWFNGASGEDMVNAYEFLNDTAINGLIEIPYVTKGNYPYGNFNSPYDQDGTEQIAIFDKLDNMLWMQLKFDDKGNWSFTPQANSY